MAKAEERLDLILESERLVLKPVSFEYKEDVFREFTSEVAKYMAPQPTGDIKDTEEYISSTRKKIEEGATLDFNIILKDSGEYVGNGGIHHIDTKTPELGLWIKKSAHGNKYGREAMARLKQWADDNIDYEYIKYPVVPENIASRKIPESLGGIVEAEYDHENQLGAKIHLVEYRIHK